MPCMKMKAGTVEVALAPVCSARVPGAATMVDSHKPRRWAYGGPLEVKRAPQAQEVCLFRSGWPENRHFTVE